MTENSSIAVTVLNNKQPKLKGLLGYLGLERYAKPIVTILHLEGVIGKVSMRSGLTIDSLNKKIEDAFAPKRLAAVCIIINSPGGSPAQSELIAKRIIALTKEKKVPVYAFVQDIAASGGYWLACAADKIYAANNSIIGSIGVVSAGFGFVEALKKLGVERRVHYQGNNKSILDPFKPEQQSDIDILMKLQKQIHHNFISYVKSRRGSYLTQSDEILFNGEFWTADIAKDFGLIDGIDDLYSFIENEYGDKVELKYIAQKESWIRRKIGLSFLAKDIVDEISGKIDEKIIENNLKLF